MFRSIMLLVECKMVHNFLCDNFKFVYRTNFNDKVVAAAHVQAVFGSFLNQNGLLNKLQ